MWCRRASYAGKDYSGNNIVQQARPPLGSSLDIKCDAKSKIEHCSFKAPSGVTFSIKQTKDQFQNGRILVISIVLVKIFLQADFH